MKRKKTKVRYAGDRPKACAFRLCVRIALAIFGIACCALGVPQAGAEDEVTHTNDVSYFLPQWGGQTMAFSTAVQSSEIDETSESGFIVTSSSAPANSFLFTDDFNRANGALGSPWTIGNTNQTDILSDQARFTSGTPNPYVVGLDLPSFTATNFTLSVDINFATATQAGLWFLGRPDTSASSGYAVRLNAATSVLQAVNFTGGTSVNASGWSSNTFTNAGAINTTDVFRMVVATSATADSFDILLTNLSTSNSVFSFTATRASAFANPNAGNLFGLYGQGSGARFDNFSLSVTPDVTGATFSLLEVGEMTLGGSSNSIATIAGTAVVNADGVDLTVGAMSGGTLNVNAAGAAVTNITGGNIAVSTNVSATLLGGSSSGVISGAGALTKAGNGTLTLSGANSYSGGTTLDLGVLRLDHVNAAGSGAITQSGTNSTLQINTTGTVANAMSIYNIQTLQTVTLSGNKTLNNATYAVDPGTTTTESGVLSGGGGITKLGTGTLLVTASNTFTGTVDVQAGLLSLASATGSAAGGTTNVIVAPSATLLIAQSNQVNNAAPVTLSGGTIQRAGGVSEVFGNLNVSSASCLDFGSGTEGTLSFGTYTASALLTVNNFFEGNVLTFGTDLSSSINNTNSFQFDNAFTSSWNQGTSTFTITAIPEPSAYIAAVALLGLVLWPAARRVGRAARPACRRSAAVRCALFAKTRTHDHHGASNY